MASTVLPGVPANIALQTGPMLLGNLFGYGLYGVLVVQLFIYYHGFPSDSIYLKAVVWLVFLIDTIITVFGTITAWNGLAKGWGDLATLAPLDWPFVGLPFMSGLVASIVHFFFAWRIWKLTKVWLLPCGICTISLLALGMATFSGVHGRTLGLIRLNELKPWVIVWLGGSTLVDVAITISMVTILFRAKNSTMFKTTSSGISKLITVTVETGMTTAVGAFVELILFVVFPTNNLHFILFLMLAKLYSNTLLATLNARVSLGVDKRNNVGRPALWNDDSVRSGSSGPLHSSDLNSPLPRIPAGAIQVSTTMERREDLEMFTVKKDDRYTPRPRDNYV